MKVGEVLELAIWLSGKETERELEHWKTVVCPEEFNERARRHGLISSPPEFTIKQVGEDRVPVPPAHISGPDVRLLVAEAKVGPGRPVILKETGFAADLEKNDLARLRRLTRAAHTKTHPGDRLTDRQCDQIIEAQGPDVAVKTLEDDRNGRSIH